MPTLVEDDVEAKFHRHVWTTYCCVLEIDRLVACDLRS